MSRMILVFLGACNLDTEQRGTDDSGMAQEVTNSGDSDGDGYDATADCDDDDAAVNPRAIEVCDGIDNDCDEAIDDEDNSLDLTTATTWYPDGDGDTFGDGATSTVACRQPDQTVTDATDCDDKDDSVHPSATEVCNSIDDDCDHTVDEADDSFDISSATTYHVDADGDGFGDPHHPVLACESPPDTVEDGSDCDDNNDGIHPGVVDYCDFLDNDCDPSTGVTGASWQPDGGVLVDFTSELSGDVTLDEDGTLTVCAGTFYVNLDITASVRVVGAGIKESILDGNASGSTVAILGDGHEVEMTDLTLQNGEGDTAILAHYGYVDSGGNIACQGDSSIVGENLLITGGHASDLGGGIAVERCAVTLETVEVSNNEAFGAGGALLFDTPQVTFDTSFITDNRAVWAGGVYTQSSSSAPVSFIDTLVASNSDEDGFSGLFAVGSAVSCVGDPSLSAGFISHDATAVVLYSYATFDANSCDFGTEAGGDDNGEDLGTIFPSTSDTYTYGDDATFVCDVYCG